MNTRTFLVPGMFCAAISLAPPAHAGFITEQTAGLDAIYSQASFGDTPVEIRFNAPQSFARPDLLNIDSLADIDSLFNLVPDPHPSINAFFVDTISNCFGAPPPGLTILGCSEIRGPELFVNSNVAALTGVIDFSPIGAILLGHELGHTLGLTHIGDFSSSGNLMNPVLNWDVLEPFQVDALRFSPLIQFDPLASTYYVTIDPIAITDTVAVPAPPIGSPLIVAGVLLWFGLRWRTERGLINGEHS